MNPEATITVVEPGTRIMKSYRVMQPLDRLVVGDCWIQLTEGNNLAVHAIHPTWLGSLVETCPTGLYLRPVAARKP